MFIKIKKDSLVMAGNSNAFQLIKRMVFNHTFHLILFYRFGCFIKTIPLIGRVLRRIVEYLIRIVFSSDISCQSRISGGLNIMHGHGIVIGSAVVVGENLKIFDGVTLGNKETETGIMAQPIIGDNVVIGTGAKILGSVVIGSNVTIGANSVVTKDIPSDTVWAGVPARLIG